GQVLVTGGQNSFGYLSSAELYDPVTGMWTTTGSMASTHSTHTATLLTNGQVLVVGGSPSSNAELYDPATATWRITGSMQTLRSEQTATLLPNGKVLVAGGIGALGDIVASAALYDPATEVWTPTGRMTTA